MMAVGLTITAVLSVSAAEQEKPTSPITKIRNVTYLTRDSVELKADILVPAGEGLFPGVLLVHGGGWMSGNKLFMNQHARVLARNNYTAVSISYRFAPKHKFPAQLEDCRAALRWMKTNAHQYKIDTRRLAVYGYSAGGHLVTLMGLSPEVDRQDPERVKAIVAGGAPCDFQWIGLDSQLLVYLFGGTRRDLPESYRQASPVTFVSRDDPPVFFFHGESDLIVPRASSRRLAQKLTQAGIRTETLIVPKAGHIETFLRGEPPARAVEFLDGILKSDEQ